MHGPCCIKFWQAPYAYHEDFKRRTASTRSNGGERGLMIRRISDGVRGPEVTFRRMGHADVRPASLAGQLSAPNCIGARCTETAFRWRAVRYDPAGFKFASVVSGWPLTADRAPYLLLASCAQEKLPFPTLPFNFTCWAFGHTQTLPQLLGMLLLQKSLPLNRGINHCLCWKASSSKLEGFTCLC